MEPQMKSRCALLPILCCMLFSIVAVAGTTHECTKDKWQGEDVCMFRNVVYRANDSNFVFKASTSDKVHHVVFNESTLNHIPREFLSAFPDLKALTVIQTNLSSVVIPAKLERLYASNNRISKVIVHQTTDSTTMLELMLDSNQLSDITNLTRLAKLEILNLGDNQNLPIDDAVDLGRFKGLNALRHLVLSDVGMMYIENERKVTLPSLELLDLSNNNLITSNLDVEVFAPLKELQYLFLSHTLISDLMVLQLTQNNPKLKTVSLEGNSFKCGPQQKIVEHLTKNGIETTRNKDVACTGGLIKQNDMCCVSDGTQWGLRPDTVTKMPEQGPKEKEASTNTPSVTRPVTTTPLNNVLPTTVAPRGNTESKGSGATLVTLGSSMLSLTFAAIVKLALF